MNSELHKSSNRYQTIDSMRGIAAMAVVFYHLSGNLQPELNQLLPNFIKLIFSYGFLGVPVFFVISGFVISLSIKNARITPTYAGTFVLRRSVRLDLTYWASIAFALILLNMKNQILGASEPSPSFSNIIFHMFYLQDLLQAKPIISVVYWTLCLEVQLYLFYIFTVWFSQKLTLFLPAYEYKLHIFIIGVVGIISLLLEHKLVTINIPGLFISSWHYFLMGILVSNVVRKLQYSTQILFLWVLIELLFQFEFHVKAYVVTGVISTLLIYFLWRKNLLNTFLVNNTLQYLGKISYTLYLLHPDVGWKVISFCKFILQDQMTPAISGLVLILGILVSVACAHLFHLAFEKPSLWLCAKLKGLSVKEAFILIPSFIYKYLQLSKQKKERT